MTDFFAMGGYAAYVWPAYAVTVVMLVGLMVSSVRSLRRRRALLAVLTAAQPVRARAAAAPIVPPAMDPPASVPPASVPPAGAGTAP